MNVKHISFIGKVKYSWVFVDETEKTWQLSLFFTLSLIILTLKIT